MTQESAEKYRGPNSGNICLLIFPQLTAFIFEATHSKKKCQQENLYGFTKGKRGRVPKFLHCPALIHP